MPRRLGGLGYVFCICAGGHNRQRHLIQPCYGPEHISEKLREWAEKQGVTIQHVQPGQPQQNTCIERYNRTVKHKWLDQYIIESIEEAQGDATQWLWTYNHDRART